MIDHFKPLYVEQLQERITALKNLDHPVIKCAITGVAGSGKSELAKAFVTQFRNSSTIFTWRLDPDPDGTSNNVTKVSYRQAYLQLLHNFSLPHLKAYDEETPLQMEQRLLSMLWSKINQYSSWILIFDNAASLEDIERHLPTDPNIHGSILVTTQNPHFFPEEKQNLSLNQGLQERNTGVQLLEELSTCTDSKEAQLLAKKLDYLPLGLRLAGAFIRSQKTVDPDFSFTQYIRLMDQNVNPHLSSETAIHISIRKAKAQNPKLYEILKWCAFLDCQKLEATILFDIYKYQEYGAPNPREDMWWGTQIWNRIFKPKILHPVIQPEPLVLKTQFNTAMGNDNYSLIVYDRLIQGYYLHRTTQVGIRSLITSPIQTLKLLVALMLQLYPFDRYSIRQLKYAKKWNLTF